MQYLKVFLDYAYHTYNNVYRCAYGEGKTAEISSKIVCKNTVPFVSFPYICPEPVLVKSSFLCINGFA